MATKTTTKKTAEKTGKRTESAAKGSKGLSAEEQAALKNRLAERKAERSGKSGETLLLEKLAELDGDERRLGERIHEIVMAAAPSLEPKTWYGMPAYAKDGKVLCFFQPAKKFDARYSTFGFNDNAKLDDGEMWPASYALTKLTPKVEKEISALVKRAAR